MCHLFGCEQTGASRTTDIRCLKERYPMVTSIGTPQIQPWIIIVPIKIAMFGYAGMSDIQANIDKSISGRFFLMISGSANRLPELPSLFISDFIDIGSSYK